MVRTLRGDSMTGKLGLNLGAPDQKSGSLRLTKEMSLLGRFSSGGRINSTGN